VGRSEAGIVTGGERVILTEPVRLTEVVGLIVLLNG
jgi:hypothetical protein